VSDVPNQVKSRTARERAYGATSYERSQTRKLAEDEARRSGRDAGEVDAFFQRILKGRGYAAIRHIKALAAANPGALDVIIAEYGDDGGDYWTFYH
jgi:hypothetical protein